MAGKLTSETRRLYSWWWDSHISPKNSKWLQENLTDLDAKVKAMIKIINEDADSFAKRAEMYYKKRPELMKLVEEFYRAYRALAERYDHATGELRLAHRTMIEAFPNQMPYMLSDDPNSGSEPPSPVTPHLDGIFDPESSSDVGLSKKGLKQLNEIFKSGEAVLRELKSAEGRLRGNHVQGEEDRNHSLDLRTMILNESERAAKVEAEMQRLRQALAKMEAERDAVLAQYRQTLEKLSNMEKELSSAQLDAKELEKCGNEAQSEVEALRESLRNLKQEVSRSEDVKRDVLAHYQQSLDKISALEERLWIAEESDKRLSEHNEVAESDIKALKEEVSRLNKEKEDAFLRYQECLEMVSKIQNELMEAKEEANQCALLEGVNQSLKLEANDLVQEIVAKDQQLVEKHTEVERLINRLEGEQSRFMQVEATLHTLQNMHSQSRDEQRNLASELRNEIQCLKEKNRALNDLRSASSETENDMKHEVLSLKEINEKLEEEVSRQAEGNAVLQQKFYQLKEALEHLYKKYQDLLQQLESAGISIKDLQDENSRHKQISEEGMIEKEALLRRLEDMEGIVKKSAVLESSLFDVKVELESSKEKMKDLQESCNALSGEKSNLVAEKSALLSQLQIITESMQKLLEKNVSLETSLHSANIELEGLRVKSRSLEDFCQFLKDEKSSLQTERSNLVIRLERVEKKLEKLETRFTRLEDKYVDVEKERDSALDQVEELRISLVCEKQDCKCFVLTSEVRLSGLEDRIHHLEGENYTQLEKAVSAQVEIFILKKFMKDMEERNYTQLEAAKYSEKVISELESENMMQHLEIEYLLDKVDKLRRGICQVLKALEIDHVSENDPEIFLTRVHGDIKEIRRSLLTSKDENHQLMIQNKVLSAVIKELSLEGLELKGRKDAADHEFFVLNQQHMVVVAEKERGHETLKDQMECLSLKQEGLERECVILQKQHSDVLEANWFLQDKLTHLETGALGKSAMKQTENIQARELIQQLEEKNRELNVCNEELSRRCLIERERLIQKEQRIKTIEDVNTELHTTIEGLQVQCKALDVSRGDYELQMFELSECAIHQDKEIESLREANGRLGNDVGALCEEIEACKIREVILNSELHEISSEFELWEAEATSFYFDLQISSVRETFFEDKVHELSGLCKDLEDAGTKKSIEIESLKDRISFLESERKGLISKVDAYVPAITSLKDNIASLEQTTSLQTKLHCPSTPEQQDAKEQSSSRPDGLLELQELQSRVKAIESVLAIEKTSTQDRVQTNIKHEATTKEIEKMKSRNNSLTNVRIHDVERRDGNLHGKSRELGPGTHMKDIPLDYISDASPSSHRRRKSSRLSDQLVGLWEASELDSSHNISLSKTRTRTSSPRMKGSMHPEIEKELGVDKLEVSKHGGNKKAVLDRLASDAQKLASLQNSVQELRRKMEINKKSKFARDVEYKRLKGQLHDVENSMVQLVSVNTELTKTIKGSPSSSSNLARSREIVEVELALRMKMLEQSRRDSERIGSLQLEMQTMQSTLLKLEDAKNNTKKGVRSGLLRSRTGIILREFVYGRSRSRKQKKSRFCGCFRQSHKEV